jgi:hypothetical protein
MDIDVQAVINDLLEQNKQLTLQLAVARATISQLQAQDQTPVEAE